MEYATSMEVFEAMRLRIEQTRKDMLSKIATATQERVTELSKGKLVPDIREAGPGVTILSIPADPRTKQGQMVLATERQTGAFARAAEEMTGEMITKTLNKKDIK